MKKIVYTIWAFCLLILLLSGCERSGWDEGKMYVIKDFKPVKEVTGEGSYGRALLTWKLPDSTSSLNYIDVTWKGDNGEEGHKVFAKYLDTVWVMDLAEANYTFEVVSCGEDGENAVSSPMTFFVADWQKEPTAAIEDFKPMVAENFLFLNWKHPQHITYTGVNLKLYEGTTLVDEVFIESNQVAEYTFPNLKYSMDYQLIYESVNLVDSISGVGTYDFQTGFVAPAVPDISLGDRTNYAHSADLKWTPAADTDSLLVKFAEIGGGKREYKFGAQAGTGYISLVPGGTISMDVQAKGTNGTWSLARSQKIKTRLKEEIITLKDGKVAECLADKLGINKNTKAYSFEQLSGIREVTMKYQIEKIDEVELLVNLEILQMGASYPPSLDKSPTVEAFLQLIDRLPKIKELRVNSGWPRSKDLEKAFKDHPKVKFVLN